MKMPILLTALRYSLVPLVLAAALNAPPARANGNPPEFMSYQGYLTDIGGNPLGSTNTGPKNYDVLFRIYDAGTAGNRVSTEVQTVTVDKGYFSVLLGSGGSIQGESQLVPFSSVFTNSPNSPASDRFLEITVVGIGVSGADLVIKPRQRLLTSPYAFLARYAVNAASAGTLVNSDNSQVVSITATNVGVDQANPASALDVNGLVTAGALNVMGASSVQGLNVTNTISAGALNVSASVSVTNTLAANNFVGSGTIPIGGIIMWSGATNNIPAGWALCNGQTVNGQLTPNLLEKFVVGAGNLYNPAGVGGSASVSLTTNQFPAHAHTYEDGYFTETRGPGDAVVLGNGQGGIDTLPSKVTGQYDNDDNNNYVYWRWMTTMPNTYAQQPVPIMPAWYALAYLMRVQ